MRSREASSASPAAAQRRWLHRWWLDRSVRTKGLIVVAIPLIALTAITGANLALQYNERQARSVATAGNTLAKVGYRVLADAVNGETGVRGYAATRDPLFLAPYNLMLTRIGAERTALRNAAIAEGDSRQQRVVNAATGRVLSDLARLRSAIGSGVPLRALKPMLDPAQCATREDRYLGGGDQRAQRRRPFAGAARRAYWCRPVHLGHLAPRHRGRGQRGPTGRGTAARTC
jgi:hypothetical protein